MRAMQTALIFIVVLGLLLLYLWLRISAKLYR